MDSFQENFDQRMSHFQKKKNKPDTLLKIQLATDVFQIHEF